MATERLLEDNSLPLSFDGRVGNRNGGNQGPGIRHQRFPVIALASATSTNLPRYMTATRSETCRIARAIVRNKEVSQILLALSCSSRFMIWAWMETSRAEMGSSATMKSGSTASARAIPMRWRWPPENSCG